MREQQLPLHLKLPDLAVFESYFDGPNREARTHLTSPGPMTWLWGPSSTGKTHLLQSVAAANLRSAYLPLTELGRYGPSVLDGYDSFDVVCVDDVDAVLQLHSGSSTAPQQEFPATDANGYASGDWERALFKLFNVLVVERQRVLVVASQAAPKNVDFDLADLASRLLSGPVFQLLTLNDEQRLEAIQLRASRRGLKLPDATGHYLLKRMKRDMRSLCEFLDQLDTASLIHQSRLTIPLVKTTLDLAPSKQLPGPDY